MMTETEWQSSIDSIQMLQWLGDKISPRKKRLFGCALCHKLGHLLRHAPAYHAIEAAEHFADNLLDEKELRLAYNLAYSSLRQCKPEWGASYFARCAVVNIVVSPQPLPAMTVQGNFRMALRIAAETEKTDAARHAFENARKIEAELLRDIVGNPFSQVGPFGNDRVKTQAEFVYANRRFDLLPEIANLLQEPSETPDEVLNHCRQAGEHTRGCWVIDALVGKS